MAKKIIDVKYEDGGAVINYDDQSSTYAQYANQPASNDNFQLLKNPTSGKIIQVSKEDFQTYGQQLSDNASLVPVGASEFTQSGGGTTDSAGTGSPLDGIKVTTAPKPTITQSDAFTDDKDLTAKQIYERDAATERARIESSVATQKIAAQKAIDAQYSPYIEEAEQYREDITDATKGQFATDRRASTAALSFVDKRRSEAQKQVNNLLQQKEQALATLDVNTQDKIDKQIEAWRSNEQFWLNYQQSIEQQKFNQWATTQGLDLNRDQFNLQKQGQTFDQKMAQDTLNMQKKANLTDEQLKLVQIDQAKFELLTGKKEDLLNQVNSLAASGFDMEKISPEYKRGYEATMGIPAGTFDGIYHKLEKIEELNQAGKVVELNAAIQEMLINIPSDQTMSVLGQTYNGLKDTSSSYADQYEKELELALKEKNLAGTLDVKDKLEKEFSFAKTVNSFGKDPIKAINKLGEMETSYKSAVANFQEGKSINAQSNAFVTNFNKLLDPISVVRESEYARVGAGQSVWNRITGTYDKIMQGGTGLSMTELEEFAKFGKELVGGYESSLVDTLTPIYSLSTEYGLNLNNIFTPKMLDYIQSGAAEELESTEDVWTSVE